MPAWSLVRLGSSLSLSGAGIMPAKMVGEDLRQGRAFVYGARGNYELEEGEALSGEEDTASADPDISLSYMDGKIQGRLGQFQKKFECGESGEVERFDQYGSFLPIYWRESSALAPPEAQRVKRAQITSNNSVSKALTVDVRERNSATASACTTEEFLRQDSSRSKYCEKEENVLKVRLKLGMDRLPPRSNATIYSDMGLEYSSSSSGEDESPPDVHQIAKEFAEVVEPILSPLPDSLLCLKERQSPHPKGRKYSENNREIKSVQDRYKVLSPVKGIYVDHDKEKALHETCDGKVFQAHVIKENQEDPQGMQTLKKKKKKDVFSMEGQNLQKKRLDLNSHKSESVLTEECHTSPPCKAENSQAENIDAINDPTDEASAPSAHVIKENWVCCDKCQKWRLLPYGTNPDSLPQKWICPMLDWLPGMNTCAFSEDETTTALHALYQLPLQNDRIKTNTNQHPYHDSDVDPIQLQKPAKKKRQVILDNLHPKQSWRSSNQDLCKSAEFSSGNDLRNQGETCKIHKNFSFEGKPPIPKVNVDFDQDAVQGTTQKVRVKVKSRQSLTNRLSSEIEKRSSMNHVASCPLDPKAGISDVECSDWMAFSKKKRKASLDNLVGNRCILDDGFQVKDEAGQHSRKKEKKVKTTRTEEKETVKSKKDCKIIKGDKSSPKKMDLTYPLKGDLSHGSRSIATTSSSSKISNKSNFQEISGSPVESVCSSPLNISNPIGLEAKSNFVRKNAVCREWSRDEKSDAPWKDNTKRESEEKLSVKCRLSGRSTLPSGTFSKHLGEKPATSVFGQTGIFNRKIARRKPQFTPYSREEQEMPVKARQTGFSHANEESKAGDFLKRDEQPKLHGRNFSRNTMSTEINVPNFIRKCTNPSVITAFMEARELKHAADRLKAEGLEHEGDGIYFDGALKFLHVASLLESTRTENGNLGEAASLMYYDTANLFGFCAHEFEKCKEMAAAALAYKCVEVALMKVVFLKHSTSSKDQHELQSFLMIHSGESPLSSASHVDNLNNQSNLDKALTKDLSSPQSISDHSITAYNRPSFIRLLNFAQDVNHAMEASRKSYIAFNHARAHPEESCYGPEGVSSVKRVLDFSFHDVEGLLRLVRPSMDAVREPCKSRESAVPENK